MYEFLDWRVKHAMARDPVCVRAEAPLSAAQDVFEEHDFNALPVTDGDGVLVGLVTKLDVLRAFRFEPDRLLPPYHTIMKTPIGDVMRKEVDTATPMEPLTRVVEQLIRTGHKSMPVVERSGLVVGMIAREDVLSALRRALDGEKPPSEDDE